MAELTQALPPYQFLVAFSQLVSRVTHPNVDVFYHLEVQKTIGILYACSDSIALIIDYYLCRP